MFRHAAVGEHLKVLWVDAKIFRFPSQVGRCLSRLAHVASQGALDCTRQTSCSRLGRESPSDRVESSRPSEPRRAHRHDVPPDATRACKAGVPVPRAGGHAARAPRLRLHVWSSRSPHDPLGARHRGIGRWCSSSGVGRDTPRCRPVMAFDSNTSWSICELGSRRTSTVTMMRTWERRMSAQHAASRVPRAARATGRRAAITRFSDATIRRAPDAELHDSRIRRCSSYRSRDSSPVRRADRESTDRRAPHTLVPVA